jgi:hypothetical protein
MAMSRIVIVALIENCHETVDLIFISVTTVWKGNLNNDDFRSK